VIDYLCMFSVGDTFKYQQLKYNLITCRNGKECRRKLEK
jgi:hypothetical protein